MTQLDLFRGSEGDSPASRATTPEAPTPPASSPSEQHPGVAAICDGCSQQKPDVLLGYCDSCFDAWMKANAA